MKRQLSIFICALIMCVTMIFGLSACKEKQFDMSRPSLLESDGWKVTLHDDFSKVDNLNNTAWRPTAHGARWKANWCDEMVDLQDDALVVHSYKSDNHVCGKGICPSDGIFTGGVDTYDRENNTATFSQAFGYYEATVKVPLGSAMWSAFWLQSMQVGKVGNKGMDGTEIDIYESSMLKTPTLTGNALHYDAYDFPYYRVADNVYDTKTNLYDGEYHTYSLLWTPDRYVFFTDGVATWASDFGGVARVPQYLRLTVEIRENTYGPYAAKLDNFANADDGTNDFSIREVKVYQNDSYIEHIMSDSDYSDHKSQYKTHSILLYIAIAIAAIGIVTIAGVMITKRIKYNRTQGQGN